jgi:hypothetical protein
VFVTLIDSNVEGSEAQFAGGVIVTQLDQVQYDPRVFVGQTLEGVGYQGRHDAGKSADHYLSCDLPRGLRDSGCGPLDRIENGRSVIDQHPAGGSQGDVATLPLEQRSSDLLFKDGELLRHG